MTTQEVQLQLKIIFKEVFKKEIELNEATTASDVDAWDSLNHIILIKAIEDHFQIEFDLFDMIDMKSVGDMVRAIQTKLDASN